MGRTFNYRILAEVDFAGTEFEKVVLAIHRVYYENGKPVSYGDRPVRMIADDKAEFKRMLSGMQKCLDEDILWGGDKFPEIYKP